MHHFKEKRNQRADSEQFATFHVGDLFFGIPAVHVQEVIRQQEMTPIPLSSSAVKGFINLRGQIVTAIDARTALDLQPGPEAPPMNIIIGSEDGAVSLLVDGIGDVLEVQQTSFAPIPENVPEAQRRMITGVFKLRDRLMLWLDTERLLEAAFQ
ncbi:MAG: chemotaxis protein CheW [Acidobacteriaceae bacterium]|nr:chemotaxis protein CheW [Acidobacteriaceae bacterium]